MGRAPPLTTQCAPGGAGICGKVLAAAHTRRRGNVAGASHSGPAWQRLWYGCSRRSGAASWLPLLHLREGQRVVIHAVAGWPLEAVSFSRAKGPCIRKVPTLATHRLVFRKVFTLPHVSIHSGALKSVID